MPRPGSSSGGPGGPSQGNPKTAAIQEQIDVTVDIMRDNIQKVAQRGERLDSLQGKTGTFGWFVTCGSERMRKYKKLTDYFRR